MLPEMKLIYKRGDAPRFNGCHSKEVFENIKCLFNTDTSELLEEMVAIYFDPSNTSIGWLRVSIGGIQGTVMDNRLILGAAVTSGATGLVVAHNHPSGSVKPSEEDLGHTYKLKYGARFLGLTVMDHIIMAGDLKTYYSFMDEGKL